MISFHLFLAQVWEQCHGWWDRDIPSWTEPWGCPQWGVPRGTGLSGHCPQPLSRAGGAAVWQWCCGSLSSLLRPGFALDAVGGFPGWWSSFPSPSFKHVLTPSQSLPLPGREVAKGLGIFSPIFSYFSSLLFNPPCQKHSLVTGKVIGRRRYHQKFVSDN